MCVLVRVCACNSRKQAALDPHVGTSLSCVHLAAVLGRQGILDSLLAMGASVDAATEKAHHLHLPPRDSFSELL